MTANRQRFEAIAGLDPAAIIDVEQLPARLFVISGSVRMDKRAGAVVVYGDAQVEDPRLVNGGLSVRLSNAELTNVICEPRPYASQPYNRTSPTAYGGFGFENANVFPLNGGSRLVVDSQHYSGGWHTDDLHIRSSSEMEQNNFGWTEINRIVAHPDEARLVLNGVGAYMGLDPDESALFARVGLDFQKLHEGGVPAVG